MSPFVYVVLRVGQTRAPLERTQLNQLHHFEAAGRAQLARVAAARLANGHECLVELV